MSDDPQKAVELIEVPQGVFFRLEKPTEQYPGLLVLIYEGNLPTKLQRGNEEDVLFKVIDVSSGRVTVVEVSHDLEYETTKVVPARELPVGSWVVEIYTSNGATRGRTIGMITDDGTFVRRSRKHRNARRKARQDEE